jgi:dTDP-L-rhamnose 4-epimerase
VRVLVTGGAGFIGATVVGELLDHGHEVVVVDALLPTAHRNRPRDLDERAEHRWHSLLDRDALEVSVRGCDAVCHQAAMVGLGIDFGDAPAYALHNDVGTAELLRALHTTSFGGRIVLAGSMVVYGEGAYRCRTHGVVAPAPRSSAALERGEFDPVCARGGCAVAVLTVSESAPPRPRNVYAATKLHQEHLCEAFANEHSGVTVTSLRYHNVYGPGMPADTPYAGVASIFRSALARGESPRVFEDGAQTRDFVHVRDVARANRLALDRTVAFQGPVNIASGDPHTVLEMATALAAVHGRAAPRPVVTGEWRPGDVRHVVADHTLARTALGFVADIGFETGMRELASAPLRAAGRGDPAPTAV